MFVVVLVIIAVVFAVAVFAATVVTAVVGNIPTASIALPRANETRDRARTSHTGGAVNRRGRRKEGNLVAMVSLLFLLVWWDVGVHVMKWDGMPTERMEVVRAKSYSMVRWFIILGLGFGSGFFLFLRRST